MGGEERAPSVERSDLLGGPWRRRGAEASPRRFAARGDAGEELASHDEPFAAFLTAALRQSADEYERDGHIAELKANAFWMRYVDLCQHEFPDLRMTRLRSITSSNGPRLKFLVNMLPTGARLEHRASNGHVDLALQNRDARALAENLGDPLPIN